MKKIGPTGKYPNGKLNEHDKGEMAIGLTIDPQTQTILIGFRVPVTWIGLTADGATELARKLLELANKVQS